MNRIKQTLGHLVNQHEVVFANRTTNDGSVVVPAQHIALPLLQHAIQRHSELPARLKFGRAESPTRSSIARYVGSTAVTAAVGTYLSVIRESDAALPARLVQGAVLGAVSALVVSTLESAYEILGATSCRKQPDPQDVPSPDASALTGLPAELIRQIAEACHDDVISLAGTATTFRANVGDDLASWALLSKRTARLRAQRFTTTFGSTPPLESTTAIDRAFQAAAHVARAFKTGIRTTPPITEFLELLGTPADENGIGASGAYGLQSDKLKQAALAGIQVLLNDYGITTTAKVFDAPGNDTGLMEAKTIPLTGHDALSPDRVRSNLSGLLR